MKTTSVHLAAFLGLSLAAFAQGPKVNYTDHISPIFKNACTNCHNPDKKKAGLDLTTYSGAMAGGESGGAVKPGNPDSSLVYKLSAHLDEPKMPPKGDRLSEADLKLIKAWIAGFALETANSKPVVAQANKVDSVVVSLTRPEGPAPMPGELPMEPFVKARPLGALTTMAASPWAPLLAIGGQKQIFLYNTQTLEPLGVLAFPEGFPQVLRFSKNAKLLMAAGGLGGKSGKVVMWDVATGERIGSVGNESDAVLAADLSADHQFVALGGTDKRVKIYQTKDGKPTGLIKKHTEWVTAIAYSPDGKFLGTGDRNGGLEIWESGPEPKPYNTLAGHKAAVTAVAFMPGVLASGSEDGTIKLWNVKEGTETKSWNAHAGGVLWMDFTPDGRIVSCGRDKVAKVWDATGKALATTEAFGDLAIRATLNSERVIAADYTGSIRVYALADGKTNKVGEFTANPPGIIEQLGVAEKTAAETTTALPALQKAVADAEAKVKAETEAAAAKRKQDLAAAEARKTAAQQQIDAAKAAPAVAEKAVQDLTAFGAAVKDAIAKAEATLAEKKKGTVVAADPAKASAAGGAEAQKKFDALTVEIAKRREARSKFKEGTPEYNKANAEVQALKPELEKAGTALASTSGKAATPASPVVNQADVDAAKAALAEAQKKRDSAKQQLDQAKEALNKVKSSAPKQIAEAEKAIAAANADIAKIQNPPAPPKDKPVPLTDGQQALAKAKSELDAANARLTAATGGVQRWKRAQLYQTVFNARQTVSSKQAKYDDLVATAKDAFRSVELTKQGITAAEQTIASGPKTIAEKEAALAAAKKTADAATAQLAAAEKAVADKKTEAVDAKKIETEIAELTKQLGALTGDIEKLRAERAKTKEGTPEYNKANEAVQAKKTEMEKAGVKGKADALAASIEAAKARMTAKPGAPTVVPPELVEAVKKAQLDVKLATDKIAPAEKAVVDAKVSVAEAQKQIPELKVRIPQLEAEGAKTKTEAEQAATALAKELQAAKAELEKLRAQYEIVKGAEAKAVSAAAPPPKS